jgi:hypothetical protein
VTVGSPGHICVSGGVNNKQRPSRPSPLSQRAVDRDGCDDGDGQRLLLGSGHAYMPQAKGVLPSRIAMRGARAQHFATVRPENMVCRVCSSHLAVWASGPKARSARACAGWRQRGRCEPWCVPGSQVCTQAKRKTARDENSMLARVCSRFAGWVAEIGPRAFAHGLTHRTQLHVTLYTRARVRASRKVTTTCVRCVRHAGV